MNRVAVLIFITIVWMSPQAFAEVRDKFFELDGTPTKAMREQFDLPGLPRLLKGVDIPAAYKDADGKWQAMDDDSCVVTKFHIGPEGVMDRYVVLDVAPNELVTSAAIYALSQWHFEKSKNGAWFVFPWSLAFVPAVQSTSDTRLGKLDSRRAFDYVSTARCEVPFVEWGLKSTSEARLAVEPDMPVAPRETARAGQTGCTTLTFTILPNGSTADFESLDAKPADEFVVASAVAVSNWKFEPQAMAQRGFVNFGFGLRRTGSRPVPSCMSADYAANRYQAAEVSK